MPGKCSAPERRPWLLYKIYFYPSFSYQLACIRVLSKPWNTIAVTPISFVFLFKTFILSVWVFCYVCAVSMKARRECLNPRTGVTDSFELSHECWESNPGSLGKEPVPLNHLSTSPTPLFSLFLLLSLWKLLVGSVGISLSLSLFLMIFLYLPSFPS